MKQSCVSKLLVPIYLDLIIIILVACYQILENIVKYYLLFDLIEHFGPLKDVHIAAFYFAKPFLPFFMYISPSVFLFFQAYFLGSILLTAISISSVFSLIYSVNPSTGIRARSHFRRRNQCADPCLYMKKKTNGSPIIWSCMLMTCSLQESMT